MKSIFTLPHLIGVFIVCLALESSACAGVTYAIEPFVADVRSTSPTEFEITYEWWVGFTPRSDSKVFVHFTDSKGVVMFMDDFDPDLPLTKWPQSSDGKRVKLASRKMKIPKNVIGPFEIRMGTHRENNTVNHALLGASDDKMRVKVGQIKVDGEKVVFENTKSFSSAEGTMTEAIKKDRRLIQGNWKIVAFVMNGVEISGDQLKQLTLRVKTDDDGRWSVCDGDLGEMSKGICTIDPTKNPKSIDFTQLKDDNGEHFLGIYEIEQATRRLCYAEPGKDRPTEFSSKPGSKQILVTYERDDAPSISR